jgi:hypothetical protein
MRVAMAAIILLLLSPALWYELVYPRPDIRTLRIARSEEYRLARDSYDRLRGVPFYGGLADELWGEFFERRALLAAHQGRRDEALLFWLKALTVLPTRDEYRRAATQLIGTDYARLEKTIRTGIRPGRSSGPNTPTSGASSIMAVSPDGRRMAATSFNGGQVRVWDLERPGAEPHEFSGLERGVHVMAFSPDGRRLAASGNPGYFGDEVRVWDLEPPGAEPLTFRDPQIQFFALAFDPDSRRLAALGDALNGNWARVFDLVANDSDTRLAFYIPNSQGMAFGADGRLAIGGTSGVVRVLDLNRPKATPLELRRDPGRDPALAFSANGGRLASGGTGGVWVWDLGRPDAAPQVLKGAAEAQAVAFSPDGRFLAVGDGQGAVRAWSLERPDATPPALLGHEGPIFAVAFSPHGRRLTTLGNDGVVRIWNLDPADTAPAALPGQEGPGLAGNPEQLLAEWQRRLALRITDDGKIVTAN